MALKHNYKGYLESFFLAVLLEGLQKDGIRFVEENLTKKWLEQSEEDPLVYEFGNEDRQNSPNCILRLTKLANGSRNEGYTESSEDDVDGSSDDDPDVTSGYHTNDQLPRLNAGLSRSGRRTTRFQL